MEVTSTNDQQFIIPHATRVERMKSNLKRHESFDKDCEP